MRTSSRRTRLELQCNLPYQCSKVVLVDQSNCSEKEKEEEEEEEEEIFTATTSSRDQNYNAVLSSNGTWLYLWA